MLNSIWWYERLKNEIGGKTVLFSSYSIDYFYQANMGLGFIIALTSFFTCAMTFSSSILERIRSIISTITGISASFSPRVVIAGVPTRKPEVENGVRVSKGTIFLLIVISARTSVFSAFLPVRSGNLVRKSISIQWLSVPPDTTLYPLSIKAFAIALAFFCIWTAYSV